jgi:hypothetical protein
VPTTGVEPAFVQAWFPAPHYDAHYDGECSLMSFVCQLRRRQLWLLSSLILIVCGTSAVSVARADVDMTGKLEKVSSLKATPGEVQPLATAANGDYRCADEYSVIGNKPYYFAIGNCKAGWTLEVVALASENTETHEHSYGGYIGSSYSYCGWIDTRFLLEKLNSNKNTACTNGSNNATELEDSSFMEKYDSNNSAHDGNYVVNPLPCPEYANYRPWSTNNVEKELIRTAPAYAAVAAGSRTPALKWRYTTKYSSTDGTGQYVMVRDARITGGGEGNWVFVPRSCLSSPLPANEGESINPPPPTATTGGYNSVTTTSANLTGSVNPNGLETHYYIEWGREASKPYEAFAPTPYPGEDVGSGAKEVDKGVSATGLKPDTTYYYRIVASSPTGTSEGVVASFTTPSEAPEPPEATTTAASSVTEGRAALNGTVNPMGTDTHYYFEYGLTTSYGQDSPASPGDDAGSGTNAVPVSATATGLQPNTYYHYRLMATNSAGMMAHGVDKTLTTQVEQVGSSWAQREVSTQETWLYIPDSSAGVSAWYWDHGWSESSLASLAGKTTLTAEDEIAPGTVPTTLREPSTSETWVYFQNKNHGISAWGWFPGVGWTVTELPKASLPEGENEVAANTSPTATREPSTSATWVYFQNKQGGISAFNWSPGIGWSESVLPGSKSEEVAPGTSPTVIREPSTQETWVYFQNKSHGISAWNWSVGVGWTVMALPKATLPEGESEVAADTSPAVVREPANAETWVYFQNKQGGISAFDWSPGVGWGESVLPGSKSEEVAPGTSPTVIREPSPSEAWVYFQNKSHGISAWNWSVGVGWTVMELPGGKGEAAVTATPTVLRERSNSATWVYFENKSGGMSGFNWSLEGKGWSLITL